MKIFVDENIPLMTVRVLRRQGQEVIDIRGTSDQGMTDEKLWEKVKHHQSLLITTDKGFSNYREDTHYGILIVRLRHPTRLKIHERIMQALRKYSENEWPGLMVVMRDVVQSTWQSRNQKG